MTSRLSPFVIDRKTGLLHYNSYTYNPKAHTCGKASDPTMDARPFGVLTAFAWLQHCSGSWRIKMPVSIIGPNDAPPEQVKVAETAGAIVANLGLEVMCGGRRGVMEGAARGATLNQGGRCIGILPGYDPGEGNEFLTSIITTGLGEVRNVVVANGCACIVVVGDNEGTAIEVAYGAKSGKPMFGLLGAATHKSVHPTNLEDLRELLAQTLIQAMLKTYSHPSIEKPA